MVIPSWSTWVYTPIEMNETNLLLGLDGGQTGTRAAIATSDGPPLGKGEGGPIRHLYSGPSSETVSALRDATLSSLQNAGVEGERVAHAVLGLTGIGTADSSTALTARAIVQSLLPRARIDVLPDYVTTLEGVSRGEGGVVVAAGGGSVAYGRDSRGHAALAGGWGYLLGDEGSGYDIGRRAIAAATHAADGRAPHTLLTRAVLETFDIVTLTDIKAIVYQTSPPRERVASLVPAVSDAARQGDTAAQMILQAAGRDLALLGLAVLHRLYVESEAVILYPTGGVFSAGQVLRHAFTSTLRAAWPSVRIEEPRGTALEGALLLAHRAQRGESPPTDESTGSTYHEM